MAKARMEKAAKAAWLPTVGLPYRPWKGRPNGTQAR